MLDSEMARSLDRQSLEQVDRDHYWHPFTQMSEYEPLIIERGSGVWLEDIDGRKLLDGVSSMWCNVHGHRHPKINQAIVEQLNRVAHVTSLGMSNPTAIELTKELVDRSPSDLQCVFYSSDGASAIEVALKMAFQYWRQCDHPQLNRDRFLALGNAYHGDTLGSVSVGGVSRFHAMFAPLLFDVVRGPCPDSFRTPNNTPADQACEAYLADYRKLFERFGDRLAAVVAEPLVQGAAGMVMHPPGFLRGLKQLASEYDVLLIADEIAVGVGRTGTMWACENEDVQPDILCAGKGLGGGYLPIAATLTTRKIWDAFLGEYSESRSLFHGHTFGGNPLACAASLATLRLLDEESTLQNVRERSTELEAQLRPLLSHPQVGDVRVTGLTAAVELVRDKSSQQGYEWAERMGHRVCQAALKYGVWLRPLGNVIVIMPPLCIQSEDLQLLTAGLKEAVSEVLS